MKSAKVHFVRTRCAPHKYDYENEILQVVLEVRGSVTPFESGRAPISSSNPRVLVLVATRGQLLDGGMAVDHALAPAQELTSRARPDENGKG